jgi:tetratricopeptide (TPR) repeat protein
MILYGPADISFHLLLSEYLASTPRPLDLHTLPSTDSQPSASIVRALLSLCTAGGRKEAMSHLQQQLQEPSAAHTLSLIEAALMTRARFGEALAAGQQALAIHRSALGDAHPHTASSLNNVGITLGVLGRHEEALQHEQQALAIHRSALGDAHPHTASSLNNVGATLGKLGRHEEALQHKQQALAIHRSALGDAHPDTASSLNNVGITLHALGRQKGAPPNESNPDIVAPPSENSTLWV